MKPQPPHPKPPSDTVHSGTPNPYEQPVRLLVVEDSPRDAELVVREIRRSGLDMTWKRVDTEPALRAALESERWDAVVADYVMPHFDGLAALRVLQSCGLALPFIIVSGKIGEETAVEAMRAGVHDYIMKGNLSRLAPALERELRDADARRAGKLAEARLSASDDKYRQLIENSHDIIYSLTPEGLCTFVSPAWTALVGRPVTDLEGRSFTEVVHPDDQRAFSSFLQRVLETGQRQEGVEYRVQNISGEWRWHTSSATPAKNADGVATGYDGIGRDITEKRRNQELLMKQYAELERFNELMVGREVRMVELKAEVNALLEAAGQPAKYFHLRTELASRSGS